MDIQKLAQSWKARNESLNGAVKVSLTGIGDVYVRLLKANESEHIKEAQERAEKQNNEDDTAIPLAIAAMLCHEDGKRLTDEETSQMFEVLVQSQPARSDWHRLFSAANGGTVDSGN